MANFQEVEINNCGDGYLIQNYLFRKDTTKGDKIYLKCIELRREFCPAHALISNGNAVVTRDKHNHNVPDLSEYRFRSSLRNAIRNPNNSRLSIPCLFETVRNEALGEAANPVEREDLLARLPSFPAVRGLMENTRSSLIPPNPRSRSEIDLVIFADQMQNIDGSSFLLADSGMGDENRILLFGNARNLRLLAESGEIYMDGTFWVTPCIFYQFFTIHAFYLDQQFPLVYALLPNKTHQTYERLFGMILDQMRNRNLIPNGFMVNCIVTDYETGLITAVRNIFPHAVHQGCYFHYAQCIYRHISEMGYSVRYKNDVEFKMRCHMLMALGLVPIHQKAQFLQMLQQQFINDFEFSNFVLRYFRPTWFDHFALNTWDFHQVQKHELYVHACFCVAVQSKVHFRTNNNVESWHNDFNKFMAKPHQCIYRFILLLKEKHTSIQDSITGRENGNALPRKNVKYERLNQRITRIQREFPQRERNPVELYLRPLSYCMPEPKNNL